MLSFNSHLLVQSKSQLNPNCSILAPAVPVTCLLNLASSANKSYFTPSPRTHSYSLKSHSRPTKLDNKIFAASDHWSVSSTSPVVDKDKLFLLVSGDRRERSQIRNTHTHTHRATH